jgi:hypothetical protein
MLRRKIASVVVPSAVAIAAYLLTHATGTLVDGAVVPASIAPFAEARLMAALEDTPAALEVAAATASAYAETIGHSLSGDPHLRLRARPRSWSFGSTDQGSPL